MFGFNIALLSCATKIVYVVDVKGLSPQWRKMDMPLNI